MGRPELTDESGVAQRLVRVHEILDLCISRRMRGEPVPDEQIVAEHPELMPELAHELRGLAMIERARRSATSRSRNGQSSGAGGGTAAAARSAALIPGYQIIEAIHSGAQGVVYKAMQRSTQRTVAIKVMREAAPEGLRELSRFEREVQILATLRHPNIVSIHDSGLTPDGRAYFVMDFIEGRALDQWITDLRGGNAPDHAVGATPHSGRGPAAKPALAGFLNVFATICDAVHAAHLRGVIHRDLKPANIRIDATGQPHVLDFGLAKTVGQPAESAMTVTGQFIGSLPWSSPEQAEGAIDDIDVRTDVYALGVVLFQGLTGHFPYEVNGPMRDVLERIISAEPGRPSALARGAWGAVRVDDDLDTIALKCLSKGRERRYQSAGDLARDVRRHLAGEPIEAKRDSRMYMLRKTAARYRWALAGGSVLLALLGVFAIYAMSQAKAYRALAQREFDARTAAQEAARSATSARLDAERQKSDADRARDEQVIARMSAQRAADHAQSVTHYLVEMLGLADPDVAQSPNLTLREVLQRAGDNIDRALAGRPEAEAAVRTVIGRAHLSLGEPETAQHHLERALELRRRSATTDDAALYEVLWPLWQALNDVSDTVATSRELECERVGRKVIAAGCPELANKLAELARVMDYQYKPAQAEPLRDEALAFANDWLTPEDARWLLVADQFLFCGHWLGSRTNPGPAVGYLRIALGIYRRILPETNSRITQTLEYAMAFQLAVEEVDEADAMARESLELMSRKLPPNHWYVALFRARLGACLAERSEFDEARRLLQTGYERVVAQRGERGRHVSELLRYLIRLDDLQGDATAAREHRTALAAATTGAPLGVNWVASPFFPSNVRIVFGGEWTELGNLAEQFRLERQSAKPSLRETTEKLLALRAALVPDEHPVSAVIAEIVSYWNARRVRGVPRDLVLAVAQETSRLARVAPAMYPRKRVDVIVRFAGLLRERGRLVEAEREYRDALAILEGGYGTYAYTHWIQNTLGECLLAQKRFVEAEVMLQAGYVGLLEYGGTTSGNTRQALTNILRLYDRWDRPDELHVWTARDLHAMVAASDAGAADLARVVWRVVKRDSHEPADYRAALSGATRAIASGRDVDRLRALGGAQFRCGQFSEATATLEESCCGEGEKDAYSWALLAMARHATGKVEDAWQAWETCATMNAALREPNPDTTRLLDEGLARFTDESPTRP